MAVEGAESMGGELVLKEVALPASLSFSGIQPLLDLVAADVSGAVDEGRPGLQEILSSLAPEAHEPFWRHVLAVAGEHLQPPPPAEAPVAEAAATADLDARAIHAVAVLLSIFAESVLDSGRSLVLPPSLAEAASLCQEVLLTLSDANTQALIAATLEKICADKFEGCEDYYGGVLMFLISRCLAVKMTGADVTRLYKVRGLLGELDWEHESIESLKVQLLRCTASPSFMKSFHGADLLAMFYTVHPGFTQEVHSTVKNQVLYTRQASLKAYAVGLFKAWKFSTGAARVQVEHCVQDWVVLAIRCCRKSADRARAMLEELHRHKHEEAATELLCRLYGPVLWRDLKVANAQVRENAARLLLYTFPLIPNDSGLAEKEAELARQIRLLRETLEDPAELVRRAGVESTCVILKNYWDIMPPADIAEMLTVLMDKCAHDKKAPSVRAAVLEGFGCILDNALSHPTMGAVLPQTAELLNDKSPVVSAAFVNLLNVVSRCRGVSVGSVVGNEALLTRLAGAHAEGLAERLQRGLHNPSKGDNADPPDTIARLLSKLMAPSLFQQDIVHQVTRCRYLMQHWPLALLALLTHAKDGAPAHERVKLGAALFQFGIREASGSTKRGGSWAPAADGQSAPKMFATTLRAVGVLLEGAAEPAKQTKKNGSKFPKELEKFVYDNIREKDFLHLLEASHDDQDCGEAARLREDLLFALSPLDPVRLPRAAEMVGRELAEACRGGQGTDAGETPLPRLIALMRTAARWNLLVDSVEPAWERVLAAGRRLRQRKQAAEGTVGSAAAVEALLRDAELRGAVLPHKADLLAEMVEQLSGAFCTAWSAGVAELRAGTGAVAAGGQGPALLGPSADLWPQLLGLVLRACIHVEHRMVAPRESCPEATAGAGSLTDGSAGGGNAEGGAISGPVYGSADAILPRMAREFTSEDSAAALAALESLAQARGGHGQPQKKRSKGAALGVALPVDVECALQAHQRLLEALNAADYLAVLRPGAAQFKAASDTAGEGATAIRVPLEDLFWRWTRVADVLQPLEDGARLPSAWVFLGRHLQQMAHADLPTPDIILAARRLLDRVTDEVPARDDELKRVLQALFGRLESEPGLVRLVAELLGESLEGGLATAAPDAVAEVHPRVKNLITSILPGFRNLRQRLIPGAASPPQEPVHDRSRIYASATPQKAGLRCASDAGGGGHGQEECDASSRAESRDGCPGGRERSRSPRARHTGSEGKGSQGRSSLFGQCFEEERLSVSHAESSQPPLSGGGVPPKRRPAASRGRGAGPKGKAVHASTSA